MRPDDYTDMGDTRETFLTTHWSLIDEVSSSDLDKNRALLGLLLSKYWKPVYCYLRRKGYNNEKAKDVSYDTLTEGNTAGTTTATLLNDGFEGGLSNWNTDWDLTTFYYTSPTHSIECSGKESC